MSATITLQPTAPLYSREPSYLKIRTDKIISTAYAQAELSFSNIPTAGQTISFEFANITVTLTAANTANDSGNEFSIGGVQNIEDFVPLFVSALQKNYLIESNFSVVAFNNDTAVRLTYRTLEVLNIEITQNLNGCTVSILNSTGPYLEPNLSAFVRIYEVINNVDQHLVNMDASYDLDTREATFDLHAAVNTELHLPASQTINYSTFQFAPAASCRKVIAARYADRFGSPAQVQAMNRTSDFVVIHGGRSSLSLTNRLTGGNNGIVLLHDFLSGHQSRVHHQQPNWLYLMPKTGIANLTVRVKYYLDDGTDAQITMTGSEMILLANTPYWIPSGYRQLGLHLLSLGNRCIVKYDWKLETFQAGIGDPVITYSTVTYLMDYEHHPWNIYLLVDNQQGGADCIRLYGKSTRGYRSRHESADMMRWVNLPRQDILSYNYEGRPEWEVNSGFYEREEIERIQTLLMGPIWLVDTQYNRLLPCEAATDSFRTVLEDDENLFSLNFRFAIANYDTAYEKVI